MNIIICDDCECDALVAKEVIKQTVHKLHIKTEFDIYSNAADVERKILVNKEPADILILDIDMPEISGLELAERLRAADSKLIIIFLSAHEEFVFKAIEFQSLRFIRKMLIEREMPLAIRSAVRVIEVNRDKQIVLNTDDSKISTLIINGHEAIYFKDNNQYYNSIWDYGDYIISLGSNISKDALIEMAESVQSELTTSGTTAC